MNNSFKMPSPRVIFYWVNMLLIALTCGLLVWKGPELFFKTDAPSIYKIILYVLAGLSSLVMVYVTHRSRGNTLLTGVVRAAIIAAVSLGLAFLGGTVLSSKIIPPGSVADILKQADSLMDAGEYSGAASVCEKCITLAQEPLEVKACNELAANANYELAEQQAKRGDCIAANSYLDAGAAAAKQVGNKDLVAKFTERKEKYAVSCVVVPTPTPLPDHYTAEVLNQSIYNGRARIDFRILNNSDYVKEFGQDNFSLSTASTSKIDFSFSNRTSDDPVCVVAAFDNSGSIRPGLEGMKRAAQTLNSLRKPEDELGLVIFGDDATTSIVQQPGKMGIDVRLIDGSGGNTALWKGINLAFDAAEKCDSDNRYIIVITDGKNTEPFEETHDAAAAALMREHAQRENIQICPIGIRTDDLDENSLYAVAEGCDFYIAENSDIVSEKLTEIFGYVRDFYRIEFSSMLLDSDQTVSLNILKNSAPVGVANVTFGNK